QPLSRCTQRSGLLMPILTTIGQRKDVGMDAAIGYTLSKQCWKGLAQEVVTAVDICVDGSPRARPEHPTLHTLPQVRLPLAKRLQIEKATLGGIALLDEYQLDTDQHRLVLEHVVEPRMRNEDEMLVVPFAQFDPLLPAIVLADDQGADAFAYQELDDRSTGGMQ